MNIMSFIYLFSDNNMYNDICLMKTEDIPLDFHTSDVVCLPPKGQHVPIADDNYPINECYVAGWGQTENGQSDQLMSIRTNILSTNFCNIFTDITGKV